MDDDGQEISAIRDWGMFVLDAFYLIFKQKMQKGSKWKQTQTTWTFETLNWLDCPDVVQIGGTW